ncbi:MAG: hypothetical protein KC731_02700 [Myxococcales bacterium]|nr:hypothetical protein [Myxococcales bacterium]
MALALSASCQAPPPVPPPIVLASEEAEGELEHAEPARPSFDAVQPARSYLGLAGLGEPPRRAKARGYGALFALDPTTHPDASALNEGWLDEVTEPPVLEVVEERPAAIRVRLRGESVTLIAYLKRETLLPVVVRPTILWREGRGRLKVLPGVVVEASDSARPHVHVTTFALDVAGSVDPADVGLLYRPAAPALEGLLEDPGLGPGPTLVARGRRLLLAPRTPVETEDGQPIVVTGETLLEVDALPFHAGARQAEGDRVEVRYTGEQLAFTGWVPRASTGGDLEAGFEQLGFVTGFRGSWSRPRLVTSRERDDDAHLYPGDELTSGPGGEVIARVTRRMPLPAAIGPDGERATGRSLHASLGSWGAVSLWIEAGTMARAQAAGRVYRERVRVLPVAAAPLPPSVAQRAVDVRACWAEAVDEGEPLPLPTPNAALRLDVSLLAPEQVEIAAPIDLPEGFDRCLVEAFRGLEARLLPVEVALELDPKPLPPPHRRFP